MLTQSVATAFGRKNIRCNAVAASMVLTPLLKSFIPEPLLKLNEDATLTPLLGTPEDIARIMTFLASDDARCLTGQSIQADGGTTALAHIRGSKRVFRRHLRDCRPLRLMQGRRPARLVHSCVTRAAEVTWALKNPFAIVCEFRAMPRAFPGLAGLILRASERSKIVVLLKDLGRENPRSRQAV